MAYQNNKQNSNNRINPFQQAELLFQQGKLQEALKELDKLETRDDLGKHSQLYGKFLRCRILAFLDVNQAQCMANQVILICQKLEQPLIQLDTLCVMAEAWMERGHFEVSRSILNDGKAILDSISADTPDYFEREAALKALEGGLYMYEDKMELAFECVQNSLKLREQIGDPQAIAQSLYYLGTVYISQGDHNNALKCLNKCLNIRNQLNSPQAIAQSLYCLGAAYTNSGEMEQALKHLQKSLEIRKQLDTQYGIAQSLTYLGIVHSYKGDFEQAIEAHQYSLKILNQLNVRTTFPEARSYQSLGLIYMQKGIWDLAHKYLQRSLDKFEHLRIKTQIGMTRIYIGRLYQQQGDLDAAFQYGQQSMKVLEDAGIHLFGGLFYAINLNLLVWISIEQGNMDLAKHYLQQLEILKTNFDNKPTEQAYYFAQAMILKASPRPRDKMRAQDMFRHIMDDVVISFEYSVWSCLNLCELLFYEFKTFEIPDILNEIKAITDHLLDLSKKEFSYTLIVETYLLQAKLAQIEQNEHFAQQLLTQAHIIANDKGLHKLAMIVSFEIDKLLAQLTQSKKTPKKDKFVKEAEEDIKKLLKHVGQQREMEPPAVYPEESVLFLILTEGGLSIFSEKFELGEQLDDQLIGGLLAAINAFGKEVFAGSGIDRIVFHGYTVAVKPLIGLLVCYVYIGDSYLAIQNLDRIIKRIKVESEILGSLNHHIKSREALRINKDLEWALHEIVMEIIQPTSGIL